MLGFDSNYIGAKPIKGNSEGELMRAWKRCCEDLSRAGFRAALQRIGSEASKKMAARAELSGIEAGVAAPGSHRANPAERAIQDYRARFPGWGS